MYACTEWVPLCVCNGGRMRYVNISGNQHKYWGQNKKKRQCKVIIAQDNVQIKQDITKNESFALTCCPQFFL